MPEECGHMWGIVDNYIIDEEDGKVKPAGCRDRKGVPSFDKSRMSDEQKLNLRKVCERAKLGYYLDLEAYKKTTDPHERARLSALMESKYDLAERIISGEQKKNGF